MTRIEDYQEQSELKKELKARREQRRQDLINQLFVGAMFLFVAFLAISYIGLVIYFINH